jgi:PAT family beta-lactamase induction signal transducer AmpG
MFTIPAKDLINRRLLAVLFLGFASGLPLALTSSTLQAWFTEANVSLATIGAISLIGIPYTLKFLWAPLMDCINIPWLGMRRGWIILMQFGLALALFLIANMSPSKDAAVMFSLAIAIAFLAASQDVAIDAYRTDVLHPEERGLGASYYVLTYRIAVLVSGGLALICADYFSWKLTYTAMAVMMLLAMIVTYSAPKTDEVRNKPTNILQAVLGAMNDLLQRDKIILLLLFLIFYKFGDALALQLMTNFLLHGLGFSLTEVGLAYKVTGFIATVMGGLIGGIMLTRWSVFRALLVFGLAQAFSNFMFVVLAVVGKQFILMAAAIFIENFCSGLTTAAFIALMMSLCDHRYTASQFALLSAITSLGRVLLGPVAVLLVNNFGWVPLFGWSFALSFPGIAFLLLLRNEVSTYAPTATAETAS